MGRFFLCGEFIAQGSAFSKGSTAAFLLTPKNKKK
jgi:hypothetical protein